MWSSDSAKSSMVAIVIRKAYASQAIKILTNRLRTSGAVKNQDMYSSEDVEK